MPAPVGHTCPMIDKTIGEIGRISRDLDNVLYFFDETTPNKTKAILEELVCDLKNLCNSSSILEEIRAANSALREWGKSLEERVEELEIDLEAEQKEAA